MSSAGVSTEGSRTIRLKRLVSCTTDQQKQIREIRNQPAVRTSMYTDHIIGLDEHFRWVENLKNDKRQIVFAVLNEQDAAIGLVSLNGIDLLHKKSDWAFYLDEHQRGGLGAALEFTLIEYAFNDVGIEKLNCEVIETNALVVKMHKKFFFEEEGFRRSNIIKNGARIGVVFLGLTRQDWIDNRDQVIEKYRSVLDKFSIHFVD